MTAMEETAQATTEEARARAERIRAGLDSIHHTQADIIAAYHARDWTALGYETWNSYVESEFVNSAHVRLPREERRVLVASLREAGLSTRAIASTTGTDDRTVRRDLSTAANAAVEAEPQPVTGVNGKKYAASQPKPAVTELINGDDLAELNGDTDEPIEAEIVDEPPAKPKPATKPRTDVVQTINRVLSRANQAADAAEEITKKHLTSRTGEAETWERNLARHLESLNRLLALLKEAQQ